MREARSKGEAALDKALAEIFPAVAVTHELPVKVYGKTLFVDRVLKGYGLAFEVDGRQHSEYSDFMHGSKESFMSAKERDKLKALWLEANGYTLVRFSHKDKITPDLVRRRIQEALERERAS